MAMGRAGGVTNNREGAFILVNSGITFRYVFRHLRCINTEQKRNNKFISLLFFAFPSTFWFVLRKFNAGSGSLTSLREETICDAKGFWWWVFFVFTGGWKVPKSDKSLPKHDQEKDEGGGGALVMTKLKLSLVMTSFLSEEEEEGGVFRHDQTEVKFGHDKFAIRGVGVFRHDQTEVEFGHDERPLPPLFKLVMAKINFSLVMTRDPPPLPLCLQLRLSGDFAVCESVPFSLLQWLTGGCTTKGLKLIVILVTDFGAQCGTQLSGFERLEATREEWWRKMSAFAFPCC